VEYRDADSAIWIDVGMEDFRGELHLGWVERIVLRKGELGYEYAVLQQGTVIGVPLPYN
jgi:hypothetical protein